MGVTEDWEERHRDDQTEKTHNIFPFVLPITTPSNIPPYPSPSPCPARTRNSKRKSSQGIFCADLILQ